MLPPSLTSQLDSHGKQCDEVFDDTIVILRGLGLDKIRHVESPADLKKLAGQWKKCIDLATTMMTMMAAAGAAGA